MYRAPQGSGKTAALSPTCTNAEAQSRVTRRLGLPWAEDLSILEPRSLCLPKSRTPSTTPGYERDLNALPPPSVGKPKEGLSWWKRGHQPHRPLPRSPSEPQRPGPPPLTSRPGPANGFNRPRGARGNAAAGPAPQPPPSGASRSRTRFAAAPRACALRPRSRRK